MSMSKKDYEALADSLADTTVAHVVIATSPQEAEYAESIMKNAVENLIPVLRDDNSRFQAAAFRSHYDSAVRRGRKAYVVQTKGR